MFVGSDVFVGAETHGGSVGSGGGYGIDLFLDQPLAGIGSTGADLFGTDLVVAHDLGLGPALGHEVEDEFHSQPGAFDHRFAHEHGRIGGNVVLPVHKGNVTANGWDRKAEG